ncbi:AGE family epimerase/isomerase [Angustibacter peucedani]
MATTGRPTHADLDVECRRLVELARGSVDPRGGFGWMDDEGVPEPDRPLHLWITCRMTHVFGLAHLLRVDGAGDLADRGIAALTGLLHDDEHGGWWSEVDADGRPLRDVKAAYDHAFVLLAAATSVQAGRPGAEALLADAVAVVEEHFWDDEAGASVEQWDGAWTTLDDYRGANANMHSVEAYLAAADATGDAVWLRRAARIAERLVNREARSHGWRIPEHHDASWTPLLDYAKENPADPFRPYGATIGHAFEWARLLLHLDAALEAAPEGEVDDVEHEWTVPAAQALFDVAVDDGWSVDGAPGLVYTVDWDGVPVVRERMHWVVCEAIGAAATLYQATGEERYLDHYGTWWDYAREHLVDDRGRWTHELDAQNRPSSTVWEGKPDVYHALQATLVPRLPLAPSLAAALRVRSASADPAR